MFTIKITQQNDDSLCVSDPSRQESPAVSSRLTLRLNGTGHKLMKSVTGNISITVPEPLDNVASLLRGPSDPGAGKTETSPTNPVKEPKLTELIHVTNIVCAAFISMS